MEAYTSFAACYDRFMDNVPYDDWCEQVLGLLRSYGCLEGTLLDLACGTGNMTERLAQAGYEMIGVDLSVEMLNIATWKREEKGLPIFYVCQDMRELTLAQRVDGAVCLCDSLNYLTEEKDLALTLSRVRQQLRPGAPFVFDFNTEYLYREVLGDCTIAETREEIAFIWENSYDEESRINEYDLTLFMQEEDGRFRRFEELHYQRGYTLAEVRRAVEEAGLSWVTAAEAYTGEAVNAQSERIYVVTRNGEEPVSTEGGVA